ncbi:putative receptor-like protein kinase [Hordeum vulgare]|nr:putative receptor-like protein kinase [Hordeum vulgare]
MARHWMLVKIVSTCSNFEFKALVIQYMPNGTSHSWLHSGNKPRCLGFLKRLEIMLDVAMVMEYLHHHHIEVILHCDLKPSNVLLDADMAAHIADFGIAKLLLVDNNSIALTSILRTIVYMAPHIELTYLSNKPNVCK